MATLKPGDILKERYRIRRFISRGGMGSIYQAEDMRLEGRLCAVKEVLLETSLPGDTKRQTREQFQREANILARLDHPNLPKVSDIFSEDQSDFLVMDYVPGKDLRTLMIEARQRKEFLPEREVLSWAVQICNALIFGDNMPGATIQGGGQGGDTVQVLHIQIPQAFYIQALGGILTFRPTAVVARRGQLATGAAIDYGYAVVTQVERHFLV